MLKLHSASPQHDSSNGYSHVKLSAFSHAFCWYRLHVIRAALAEEVVASNGLPDCFLANRAHHFPVVGASPLNHYKGLFLTIQVCFQECP